MHRFCVCVFFPRLCGVKPFRYFPWRLKLEKQISFFLVRVCFVHAVVDVWDTIITERTHTKIQLTMNISIQIFGKLKLDSKADSLTNQIPNYTMIRAFRCEFFHIVCAVDECFGLSSKLNVVEMIFERCEELCIESAEGKTKNWAWKYERQNF